jgi:hypothetical protein
LPGKYLISGESIAEYALPPTERWGMPRRSAAMQPPNSKCSRMITSGRQSPAMVSRSGTIFWVVMSAKTVTTNLANSGPGAGIGGKAVQVE